MKLFFQLFIFESCLLQLRIVFCNSVTENEMKCETYYETSNYITCVTHYGRKLPTYLNDFVVLDTICKNASSTEFATLPIINSTKPYLHFRDCLVRPGVFQFFTVPIIYTFKIGPNIINPILKNNTFAGLCSMRQLFASKNGIERIELDAFKCVKFINTLDLSENRLHFLPPNVFKDMHLLSKLYLHENNFSTFVEGTFDDLISLTALKLNSNSINYLPDLIFRNLENLESLDISKNNLKKISRLLLNLKKLLSLDLSYNKLKETGGRFSNNKNLKNLHLDGNEGLTFLNDSFYGLENLNILFLNGCNIVSLPGYIFLYTPILEIIQFSYNKLEEINSEMFNELKNLRVLHLNFNSIAKIKVHSFEHNTNLRSLMISGNAITELKSNVFIGLSSLQQLDLSLNRLEKLENIFSGLTKLRELNVSHNSIKCLQESHTYHNNLASLATLEHLDISHNRIESLSNVFFNNTMIKRLDISKNPQLFLSNDSFKGLSQLRILKINYCNVTFMPNGMFSYLQKLSSVLMHGNNLQQIDLEMFSDLKNLRILDISLNEIFALNGEPFKHNNKLRSLFLFQNNLQKINRGYFSGLSSLKYLDVSGNNIEKIENNSFEFLSQLDFLNISHNSIYSLSDIITHCYNLREIDLSYNSLTYIGDKKWHKLVNIQRVRASYNMVEILHLPEIPQAIINLEFNYVKRITLKAENEEAYSFSNKSTKTEIYLFGNHLECDCHLFEFYKELTEGYFLQNVEFVDGLVCQYPADEQGKKIAELKAPDFICNISDFCPESCICKYSPYLRATILNCNDNDYRYLPVEAPYNTNILYIKRNNLISLLQLNEVIWENLTEIHADGNKIVYEELDIPKQLHYLGLSDNKLTRFPQTLEEYTKRVKDFNLTLSGNLWPCDCSIVPFKSFLSEHISQIIDISQLRCTFSNDSESTIILKDMQYSDLCPYSQYVKAIILLSSMGSITVVVSIALLIFYYKNKNHIFAYLYTHANTFYMVCGCDGPRSEGKLYDCFISYSSTDREIALRIVEELENSDYCKFCIHERNWISGKFITTNIIESIENSRKTLILLSETFLKSEWFHLEFQAAYHQTLKDKKDRLILVVIGDIPDKKKMEKDLQYVISTKTYLRWGERWFWEKLRYSIYEENYFIVRKEKNWFENLFCCSWNKSSETEEIQLDEAV